MEPQISPNDTGHEKPENSSYNATTPEETSGESYKQAFERPAQKGVHPMVVLQNGEVIVNVIKRHPFGIISMYIASVLGIAVVCALAFLMVPNLFDQMGGGADSAAALAVGAALAILILLILILGVATFVYWQNQWVVTTDSITQLTQNSLFGRQVSQLSMDNLEDVTVDQHGIIPHMFNFGTLKVESAGERSKFVFVYCPKPNHYARRILEVHEHFLEERRNLQRHNPTVSAGGTGLKELKTN